MFKISIQNTLKESTVANGLLILGKTFHIGETCNLSEILFIPVSLYAYYQLVMLVIAYLYNVSISVSNC